ncbi:Alpha-mannosidase 2 [Orchesella cincta]|uniref:Alpha-mannosidase n=1 Tax=Orchesella cincta TaxID=48709 RepID=A0A1D2NDV1_ORCCI|nr:Alpha-mannosidase 2 [Orchesella cincta]
MDLKRIFVVGTAGFVVVCLGLFYVLTNSLRSSGRPVDIDNVEAKLKQLEAAVANHRESMKEIEQLAFGNDVESQQQNHDSNVDFQPLKDERKTINVDENVIDSSEAQRPKVCSASYGIEEKAKSNLDILDIYEKLKFENTDGGVWKQGWNVQADTSRFTDNNKLKVFVIPHSHNDPGWIKTFERYFSDQTKHILNHMLDNLSKDEKVKFIWAEISYFNMWWNELSEKDKMRVKKIVANRQLEFVTGSWVMPDESSSHYYSVLTQLIEGHQWLFQHLGYIPKNGWSIDPFGMSPTMAYFLRRVGINNMLIQRTHYSIKKHLSKIQELEFKWRQSWDSVGKTDILCHMMPFYSYDVPHTCGPDPKICCQFDFKRMSGVSRLTCPWHASPQPIVTRNVQARSMLLLDQYRKKAMLYKTNVLLVPLGDDFRWEDQPEWTAQVSNYEKIFDYINSQPSLHAEVKFGTLDDYFKALNLEVSEQRFTPSVLTGDFFTYADRDDHYWSGYFTSRPFHKAMDRELMGHLRSAQILFAIMSAEISRKYSNGLESPFIKSMLGNLIVARRHLSLFQHHDGIAGTAKDHVMVDYATKMYEGLKKCNHVMQQSLHVLSHIKAPAFELGSITDESQFYEPADAKETYYKLAHHNLLEIDKNVPYRLITVFNPVTQKRTQLVTVYVSTNHVTVSDIQDNTMDFEIYPVFEDKAKMSRNIYQLSIIVEMNPLAVRNLKIQLSETKTDVPLPKIYVKNFQSPITNNGKFVIQPIEESSPVKISNGHLSVSFDKNGFAESVEVNKKTYPFSIGMFKYGAKNRPETSGLYLFIPDGEATPINAVSPFIRIVKGRLQSYVEVWLQQVVHRITLYNHPGLDRYSVDVTNVVDIRHERNFEIMMRFQTLIKSDDISYTDLNGFQMIKRKRFAKLPLQANYYPLPTATYIEDSDLRMTIVSKQPLGTASLSSGEVEVMLDRRLNQDDNRGAGQGCLDNVETLNTFKVLFETPDCEDKDAAIKPPMLSLTAQRTLHSLLHPLKAFVGPTEPTTAGFSGVADYTTAQNPENLACDVQVVDMPMLPTYENSLEDDTYVPTPQVGFLLHRVGFDGRFFNNIPITECSTDDSRLGRFHLHDVSGDLFQPKVQQMTLSFIHEGKSLYSNESILLKPMEVYGFLLKFQSSSVDSNIVPGSDLINNKLK